MRDSIELRRECEVEAWGWSEGARERERALGDGEGARSTLCAAAGTPKILVWNEAQNLVCDAPKLRTAVHELSLHTDLCADPLPLHDIPTEARDPPFLVRLGGIDIISQTRHCLPHIHPVRKHVECLARVVRRLALNRLALLGLCLACSFGMMGGVGEQEEDLEHYSATEYSVRAVRNSTPTGNVPADPLSPLQLIRDLLDRPPQVIRRPIERIRQRALGARQPEFQAKLQGFRPVVLDAFMRSRLGGSVRAAAPSCLWDERRSQESVDQGGDDFAVLLLDRGEGEQGVGKAVAPLRGLCELRLGRRRLLCWRVPLRESWTMEAKQVQRKDVERGEDVGQVQRLQVPLSDEGGGGSWRRAEQGLASAPTDPRE